MNNLVPNNTDDAWAASLLNSVVKIESPERGMSRIIPNT